MAASVSSSTTGASGFELSFSVELLTVLVVGVAVVLLCLVVEVVVVEDVPLVDVVVVDGVLGQSTDLDLFSPSVNVKLTVNVLSRHQPFGKSTVGSLGLMFLIFVPVSSVIRMFFMHSEVNLFALQVPEIRLRRVLSLYSSRFIFFLLKHSSGSSCDVALS